MHTYPILNTDSIDLLNTLKYMDSDEYIDNYEYIDDDEYINNYEYINTSECTIYETCNSFNKEGVFIAVCIYAILFYALYSLNF